MKQLLKFTLILGLVMNVHHAFSQETIENERLRTFGLGMHIEQFKTIDLLSNLGSIAPTNKILITISPSNNFRIEPELGFNFYNDKEQKLKSNIFSIGLGAFGMKKWSKTNIYYGIRFDNGFIKNEYDDWNNPGFKIEEKTNRLSIGPAIGVEFYFGSHFSFGGEIGIKSITNKTKNAQISTTGNGTVEESYFVTDTGLLLRFYF